MATECPRCNSLNPSDSHFCSKCGAELLAAENAFTVDEIVVPRAAAGHPAEDGLSPGANLGAKYRVLGELARGGMGVVYKAEDLKLKRTVALKFLSPELTRDPKARERFVHEAQAASELDHPNVCTIHEIDETPGGQMYIAMAYYPGESLRERLQQGSLSIEETLDVVVQVARGLEKAHQRGIVHRDVKPANILRTEDGLVKIVDFGLARLTRETRVTQTGTTVGTVAYMSPEQAQGGDVDHRSDLWSLGVVLYEMLCGQLPFKGEREVSVFYSIAHQKPPRLRKLRPDVPAELERIVERALQKKPEARYSSAGEMLRDLQEHQESLRAAETGEWNVRQLLRRARTPRVAVPLLFLLLAAGLLGRWFLERQAQIGWAREEALPEIERLVQEEWRDFTDAYRLAERAEAYIRDDPKLMELFSKCSFRIDITTEPPGAKVYMKEYKAPDREWKYLGLSPLKQVRVPLGILRWKIEKEGYETVLAASSTWDVQSVDDALLGPSDLVRVLDRKGSLPPGMVRVSGAKTDAGELGDFYIDQYEVTNEKYKEFIEAGGYRDRKYWKHKFVKDGQELTWEQAIGQFVDRTGRPGPSTWQAGDYPQGQGDYPVSGISWYEAAAYAEFAGKSLPTGRHWGLARGEATPMIRWPQLGGFAVFAPFSNFGGQGPVPVGSLPGMTSYGAFDMAGNVREWCWNKTPKGKLVRGGAWNESNTYMFGRPGQAPPMDRSAGNGFRCALYPHPEKTPKTALEMVRFPEPVDFDKQEPVSDAVFEVYKEQFSYDKTALNARVEWKQENPEGWTQEKITFDAVYGGERVIAYLFLPRNAAPPYQAVIYFPGSGSVWQKSSANLETYYEFPIFLSFIVKNGRAVLYPVYKGTFERGDPALGLIHHGTKSRAYTEYLIQLVKDFRRSVDYLETRPDIDSRRLAYYGMSWGAGYGALIPAVEDRLRASVLVGGGLFGGARPEASEINYVTRIKTPTLMLNGKYDTLVPYEVSQKPMFDRLGTPAAHKQLKLYETDHIPPRNEFIKETLAWLDRYLGPAQ